MRYLDRIWQGPGISLDFAASFPAAIALWAALWWGMARAVRVARSAMPRDRCRALAKLTRFTPEEIVRADWHPRRFRHLIEEMPGYIGAMKQHLAYLRRLQEDGARDRAQETKKRAPLSLSRPRPPAVRGAGI